MNRHGVRRLICISSSAVEPDPALGIIFGRIMKPLPFKEMCADMSWMEREVRESGLDRVLAPLGAGDPVETDEPIFLENLTQ